MQAPFYSKAALISPGSTLDLPQADLRVAANSLHAQPKVPYVTHIDDRSWSWFVGFVALLTLVRLWAIHVTPLSLGPDEAQYWQWGQSFEWGYFSKPPLIGWIAGLSSQALGDSAFGVRWSAPLLHGAAALGIYVWGKSAFGARAGLYAGMLYIAAPGVMLSSAVLSTDAVLMPLTVWALFAAHMLRQEAGDRSARGRSLHPRAIGWAVCLGLCLGLGALAKYAVGFVIAGLLIGVLLDNRLRKALVSPAGLVAFVVFLSVFTPNLVWNSENEGQTLRHTVSNANFDDLQFNVAEASSWFLSQFGVFGFLTFPVGMWLSMRALLTPRHPARAWAGVALVPVIAILLIAWLSRANANWAAIAMPGLCLLTGYAFARAHPKRWAKSLLWGVIALQTVLGGVGYAAIVRPDLADRLGFGNAFADVRGWNELSASLQDEAELLGAAGIVVDARHLYHGLKFAGQDWVDGRSGVPLKIWRPQLEPDSFAEDTAALQRSDVQGTSRPWLLVSLRKGFDTYLEQDFKGLELVGELKVAISPTRDRVVKLYKVNAYVPSSRLARDLPQDLQRAAQGGL